MNDDGMGLVIYSIWGRGRIARPVLFMCFGKDNKATNHFSIRKQALYKTPYSFAYILG